MIRSMFFFNFFNNFRLQVGLERSCCRDVNFSIKDDDGRDLARPVDRKYARNMNEIKRTKKKKKGMWSAQSDHQMMPFVKHKNDKTKRVMC
jgi:hypothetical protein